MIKKILKFITNIFSNENENINNRVECYLSTRDFGDIKRKILSNYILDEKLKLGDKTVWCGKELWADYGIYGVDCVLDKYGDIEYKMTELALYFADDNDDADNEDGKIIWGENLYEYMHEDFFEKNKGLFDKIIK